MVDFFLWPVVARPLGRREDCYRWPYYFSRSAERLKASAALAQGLAEMADRLVERWDRDVALISMEALDEPLAREVMRRMKHPQRASVMSSTQLNAWQMTSGLRELDALVTSRYHAAVLSMAAGVPVMALGHDRRLEDLFEEAGLGGELFLRHQGSVDWGHAGRMLETIMEDGGRVSAMVRAPATGTRYSGWPATGCCSRTSWRRDDGRSDSRGAADREGPVSSARWWQKGCWTRTLRSWPSSAPGTGRRPSSACGRPGGTGPSWPSRSASA